MPSIKDVARLADVSISTVSRVINNHPNVSEEKRREVKKAIEELDYVPNALAQSLVTNNTNSIGILIADIVNDFYSILVRSIEDILNEKGYFTIIGNTDWEEKKEKRYVNYFMQKQVDGFILASTTLKDDFINEIAQNVPIIALDRNIESNIIDKIRVDDYKGGYKATEHLIKAGYKKVIHLQGPAGIISAEDRKRGFKDCINKYNISEKNMDIIPGCYMEECGFEGIQKYFKKRKINSNEDIKETIGVFAANDAMAFGLLKYLKQYNIDCPGKIGVVGFDNVGFADYSNPPLTTIKRPIKKMGEIAADILLDRLNQEKDHFKQTITLDVKLVERNSTKIH
ncbi:MAG: LacI family DNA-binding transcriptional regulator [Halanaerobiales bacterium]